MTKTNHPISPRRLEGKKIAIVGYGTEGQSAARFLNKFSLDFDIFDKAPISQNINTFKAKVKTGPSYLSRLNHYDIIIRSPGIPVTRKEIRAAKASGVEVTSTTNLYYEFSAATTIGVTGTKGKGTTASLIASILKRGGKSVYLVGNIGTPPLDFLGDLFSEDFVVFELSSFQLQDCKFSPHVAVVLAITSDHLDYHKTIKEYIRAKTSIVKYQKDSDYCVLYADNKNSAGLAKHTAAKIFWYSDTKKIIPGAWHDKGQLFIRNSSHTQKICDQNSLKLRGRHNIGNVLAAATAAKLVGVEISSIAKAVTSFQGLDHRLQCIGQKRGVEYYDDSYATQPESTIAAVKSFNGKSLIWIGGGSDKGADYRELAQAISSSGVKLALLMGDTADKIKKALAQKNFAGEAVKVGSMKEAVATANIRSKKGWVVLLSPASASFGLFPNAKARGEEFIKQFKIL